MQCSCGRFRNVEQEEEPEGCDSCKDGTQYVKLLYERELRIPQGTGPLLLRLV